GRNTDGRDHIFQFHDALSSQGRCLNNIRGPVRNNEIRRPDITLINKDNGPFMSNRPKKFFIRLINGPAAVQHCNNDISPFDSLKPPLYSLCFGKIMGLAYTRSIHNAQRQTLDVQRVLYYIPGGPWQFSNDGPVFFEKRVEQ